MGTQSSEDSDAVGTRAAESFGSRVERVCAKIEVPMAALGLVWLAALVVQLVTHAKWADEVVLIIWGIFVLEFAVRFTVAPEKLAFLRSNWLSLVSLALPAVPGLRALFAFKALRIARVVAAFGHVKSDLGGLLRKNGLRYVLILTLLVTFAGAGAMYGAEHGNRTSGPGFHNYGDALWWTAMLITTIGSQYWPATIEGRVVALLLSGYALGVLGYITAALSAFLIGRDPNSVTSEHARARSLDALRDEIEKLTLQVARLAEEARSSAPPPHAGEREPSDTSSERRA